MVLEPTYSLSSRDTTQVRRQLEYSIAEKKGLTVVKPPTTTQAVMDIVRTSGIRGLYTGFGLHFRELMVPCESAVSLTAPCSSRHERHGTLLFRIRFLSTFARPRRGYRKADGTTGMDASPPRRHSIRLRVFGCCHFLGSYLPT
jgi:hypothetical protein